MVTAYCIAATLTATLITQAFFKDKAAAKNNPSAWFFIAITTLLCPITLPFIISSKLRAAKARLNEEGKSAGAKTLENKHKTYSAL